MTVYIVMADYESFVYAVFTDKSKAESFLANAYINAYIEERKVDEVPASYQYALVNERKSGV